MTLRFDRGLPPAVALAVLGGLLALGALLLPWYGLNEEAVKTFMRSLTGALEEAGGLPSLPSGAELNSTLEAGMPTIVDGLKQELVGYKAFSSISVGLHALAAAGGIWAALKAWSGGSTLQQQRGELLGAAALVALRPVVALVRQPGAGSNDAFGIVVSDDLFSPGPGIFVSLLGAGLLLAAAILVKADDSVTSAADATVLNPAPGGACGPGGPPAAAAPVYAQPAPAYGPPAPSAYVPGSAYGDQGPGTLDRDSRLRRPDDPYAPPPLAAPVVPMMPAPAQVAPIHDHAPVDDTPGAIYGIPRPEVTPTHPPQRTESTAPPGFT